MANELCVYCGDEGNEREHVIPADYFGQRIYDKDKQWVVKSCATCNRLAGVYVAFSIPDKAEYILKRYRQKYKKVINTPEWSEEEMKSVGYGLRQMIFGYLVAKRVLKKKIDYLKLVTEFPQDYLMPDFIKNRIEEWEQTHKKMVNYAKRKRKLHTNLRILQETSNKSAECLPMDKRGENKGREKNRKSRN